MITTTITIKVDESKITPEILSNILKAATEDGCEFVQSNLIKGIAEYIAIESFSTGNYTEFVSDMDIATD